MEQVLHIQMRTFNKNLYLLKQSPWNNLSIFLLMQNLFLLHNVSFRSEKMKQQICSLSH